jgi:hypothetical protein
MRKGSSIKDDLIRCFQIAQHAAMMIFTYLLNVPKMRSLSVSYLMPFRTIEDPIYFSSF